MSRSFRVAVVGATGLVGDNMINILEERQFPVSELHPLASNRSLGRSVKFRGNSIAVAELDSFDFSRADIGLFSAGAEVSAEDLTAHCRGELAPYKVPERFAFRAAGEFPRTPTGKIHKPSLVDELAADTVI